MADELRIGELKFNVNGLSVEKFEEFKNRAKSIGMPEDEISVFDLGGEKGVIDHEEYIDALRYIAKKEKTLSTNEIVNNPANETATTETTSTEAVEGNNDEADGMELLEKLARFYKLDNGKLDLVRMNNEIGKNLDKEIERIEKSGILDKNYKKAWIDALNDLKDFKAENPEDLVLESNDGWALAPTEEMYELLESYNGEEKVLAQKLYDTLNTDDGHADDKFLKRYMNMSVSDLEQTIETTNKEINEEGMISAIYVKDRKAFSEALSSLVDYKKQVESERIQQRLDAQIKADKKEDKSGQKIAQDYKNLLYNVARYYRPNQDDGHYDIKAISTLDSERLCDEAERINNGNRPEQEKTDLANAIYALKDFIEVDANKNAIDTAKQTLKNSDFDAPQQAQPEETMWDGVKQALNNVAYYTGLKDMNKAIENGDNRIQIVFKETEDAIDVAGAAVIAAGSYLAQPTDAVSYVTKKFNENITEPLNNKITQLQKKAESKTEKAAADLLANTVGGLSEAASSVSNATGGTSDILSSGWKIQPYTNAVIKKSTEETLETLAEMIGGESEIDFNEAKSVVALTRFLGISKKELSEMTTEEIRAAYKERYQNDPDSQNKIKRAAIYAAMSELIERNACAMVHQFDDGVNKLDKAQKQIRSGVSGLASSPASLVDVGSGALEDTFGTTGKVIATPFNAVSGLWKTITTSFDGKDGTTKAAFTQCWSGGWADDEVEVEVQHGIDKSKSKKLITQEEQRKAQKEAFIQSFTDLKCKYAAQYGLTPAQEVELDKVAAEILKNHEYDAMDAQRIAIRAENARLRFPEFMNFMNKVHSNAENAAGDRGFWKNFGAFAEGTLLAIPRDAMNHPLKSMDILTTGICCEIALPTALGLEAVNKAGSSINKLANATTNEAKKKAGYEDGGEALFYALSSAILGYAGATNNQTDCLHGKRHSHGKHHVKKRQEPECNTPKKPEPTPTPDPVTPCESIATAPTKLLVGVE